MMNSIVLKRILLSNWTGFHGIFDFSDTSTLLQGSNGSGKSTVVDAMNLVLSGSKKFNEASDKGPKGNTDRSIASAIHNKNFKTDEVLRNHKVIAYVILEFYDAVNDKYFLHGLQMKSEKYVEGNNNVNEKYFSASGLRLEDVKETALNKDYEKADLLNKSKHPDIVTYDSKDNAFRAFFRNRRMKKEQWKDYAKQNSRVLKARLTGVDGKKISPNEFVKANVLDEPKEAAGASLETLKSQKESYTNMKHLFAEQDEKKKRLEDMLKQIEKLITTKNELMYLNGSRILIELKEKNGRLDRQKVVKGNLEKDLFDLNLEKEELEEKKKVLESKKTEVAEQISKNTSDSAEVLNKLNKEIEILENQNNTLNWVMRTVNETSEYYGLGLESLDKKEAVNACYEAIGRRLNTVSISIANIEKEIEELRNKDKELEEEINKLSRGIAIPDNYGAVDLKNEMNRILEKNGKEERSHLLYELIESIDPEWQMAIESFLGNRRYALIVDKKYEITALKVYKNYHGSLIARYKDTYREVKNNAAAKVKVKNNDANAIKYINSLLKGVQLCETEEELAESAVGLMKDGRTSNTYVYENRENRRVKLLCGQDAIKTEKDLKIKEKEKLRDTVLELNNELRERKNELKTLNNSNTQLIEKKNTLNYDAEMKLEEAIETRRKLVKEIAENEEDAILKHLYEEREQLHKAYTEAEARLYNIGTKVGDASRSLETCSDNIKELEGNVNELNEKFNSEYNEFESEVKCYLDNLEDESSKALKDLETKLVNRINNTSNSITKMQTEYKTKDKLFVGGMDEAARDRIKSQYDKLKDIDLSDTQKKIDEINERLDKSKDSFFKSIYSDYQAASNNIKELNHKLSKVPFCGDIIKIKISVKKEMNTYFEAIRNCYADELESTRVGKPYEETKADHDALEKLFSSMLNSSGSELSKYENYKNYIDTEVLLTREMEDGTIKTRSLEKDNKSNSGGQEQTPYYIILAISLLSSFGDDGLRIMLLDEAFSKMDNARTTQVLNFFKEINMQVIMSTMRTDMFSLVDITHVFKRYEDTTKVQVLTTQYDNTKGKSVEIVAVA